MPDLDETVNVDMEPEDALRVLLGEERRDPIEESETDDGADEDDTARPTA